jgi:hypothetical protein
MVMANYGVQDTITVDVNGDVAGSNNLPAWTRESDQDTTFIREADLLIWHTGFETDGATASTATVYVKTANDVVADTPYSFNNVTATLATPFALTGIKLPTRLQFHCLAGTQAKIKVKAIVHMYGRHKHI